MRFPRARRITRRSDFQRVRRKGRSYRGRHMIVGILADSEIRSLRVGYITTRRVGNAVVRSGIRRRLRGIVQRHAEQLLCGHWLVIIPHADSGGTSSAELERDWLKLMRRAGILVETEDEAGQTQTEAPAES